MNYRQIRCLLWIVVFVGQSATAQIYFMARNLGPSTNLYATDINGVISKITDDNRWRDMRADISPDGDIVFMSNRVANPKIDLHKELDIFNLFKVVPKTNTIVQLTHNQAQNQSPKISPDGRQLAHVTRKNTASELIVADLNGHNPKVLIEAQRIFDLSWAPDSKSMVVVMVASGEPILVDITIQTGARRNLLPQNESDKDSQQTHARIASVQYSPDGNKIAFITNVKDQPARVLHLLDLTTMKIVALTEPGLHVQSPVTWSQDSQKILYSALKDYHYFFDEKSQRKIYKGSMQVYLATLKGQTKQLTSGNHLHNHPVFSPDQNKIAYLFAPGLGDRTLALLTINIDGSDKRQLYGNVAANSFLIWK